MVSDQRRRRPASGGDIEIRGAVDDMISDGENILPQQIEQFLLRHAKVRDVGVVGVADERWGQVVAAFVVPSWPGPSTDELDSFWKEGALAEFKRPRTYPFVTALPRNAMGKLMRQSVAERLAATTANSDRLTVT
jgi:2-furoate---CoA ligase